MNTNKVQNRVYVSDRTLNRTIKRPNNYSAMSVPSNNISFKGSSGEAGKKFWFYLRRLGDQMKDITEIKNALIAAIGTGIIAPAIILVSPGKGDKEDKRKKATQAIRQPLSAGLQLGFQVPATILINMGIDYLNYEEKIKLFRDDKIGDLIPTEKYLSKKATTKEVRELEAKFEEIVNGKSLKQELEEKIKSDYKEVGLEISDEELEELLRCKNCTLNRGEGRGKHVKYNPFVFTEQGIYMLMTVLRGELAVKQSRALIRTFKKMKDYILSNNELIGQREYFKLSMKTAENIRDILSVKMNISSIEKQMSDVMGQLRDVVTKSELVEMMKGFVDDEDNGWLVYNTKYCSADYAYSKIYRYAKKSIYVVDNYIGLRTLVLLKNAPEDVDITLFSDNVGSKLHSIEYRDFCKEYPWLKLTLKTTGGILHDRFIVLDYGTDDERIFLCGASSKDAGGRITCIVEDFGIKKYQTLIDDLLKNQELIL